MANKDIRKGKTKKRQSDATHRNTETLNISDGGFKYCIMHDNYSATVYRSDIDGAIAVYKAADRSWKIIPGLLSHKVRAMAEHLYI